MTEFVVEQRVAEAVAREAGRRMLAERARGFEVAYKAPHDVVTRVDRLIEDHIRAAIGSAFPQDSFHGEEHGASGDGARVWLVDPIDGTLNFAQGIPVFCVSIALQIDGLSVVGVVYEVNRDELFSARLGGGAWLDGARLGVSSITAMSDAVLATGFPPPKPGQDIDNVPVFVRAVRRTRNVRRLGSAAADLAYVAAGRLDGFWEFNLSPWDTAAGYLLVQEAGGVVTDPQGRDYNATASGIVASAPAIHGAMLELFSEDVG